MLCKRCRLLILGIVEVILAATGAVELVLLLLWKGVSTALMVS